QSFENAKLTVQLAMPKLAARTREEGTRDAPSTTLPDLNSSRIWRYNCSCSGSAAVRSSRIISNAMIERRRLLFGSDFLPDITQAYPSANYYSVCACITKKQWNHLSALG